MRAISRYGRIALCALVLAGACFWPAQTEAGAQATTIPASAVNSAVYNAAWNAVYTTNRFEMLYLSRVLQELYAQHPKLAPSAAYNYLRQIQVIYERALGAGQTDQFPTRTSWDEIVLAVTKLSVVSPTIDPAVARAYTYFNNRAKSSWDQEDQLALGAQPYVPILAVESVQADIEQGALAMAANPNFAVVWDRRFAAQIGASIRNPDARAILASHPNLGLPHNLTAAIGASGSMSISTKVLQNLAQGQVQAVQQIISHEIVVLGNIDQLQINFVDAVSNPTQRQQLDSEAAQSSAQDKPVLDRASTTLSLLSALITDTGNASEGKQVQVFGNAVIQIAQALDRFTSSSADLGAVGTIGQLGSSLFTGNVVGAVLAVFSLFANNGPSPEAMILQQISQLRNQLVDLQKQMNSRFDHIDHSLNTIYSTMISQFALINYKLGVVSGGVTAVRQELVKIESTLRQLESNLHSFLDAGFRRDLLNTINGAIDYKQRTGAAMPYQPDYVNDENLFQSWATIHASDALDVAARPFNFDDGSIYNQLAVYPLDYNITYLAQLPQHFGLPVLTTSDLANPRDWALSARAYAALAQDWPQWARRIDPGRATAISAVGQALQATLRGITTLDTPNGPQPNQPLFDKLIGNYADKITSLDTALAQEETSVLNGLKAGTGRNSQDNVTIDFWASPNQTTTYIPSNLASSPNPGQMQACGGPALPSVDVPASLSSLTPSPYLLADYIKLDRQGLDACYTLFTAGEGEKCFKGGNCYSVYKYGVDVTERYNGAPVFSKSYVYSGWTGVTDPYISFHTAWSEGVKARFDQGSHQDPQTTSEQQLLTTVQDRVQSFLLGQQQTVYNTIVTDLNGAGALHDAAQYLTGAKLLLSAYITLGLPRALGSDDYLRSFLDGNQSLMDTTMLTAIYAAAKPAVGQPDVRTNTIAILKQRLGALNGVLTNYLNLVPAQANSETQPLIETTMERLQVALLLGKIQSAVTAHQVTSR